MTCTEVKILIYESAICGDITEEERDFLLEAADFKAKYC